MVTIEISEAAKAYLGSLMAEAELRDGKSHIPWLSPASCESKEVGTPGDWQRREGWAITLSTRDSAMEFKMPIRDVGGFEVIVLEGSLESKSVTKISIDLGKKKLTFNGEPGIYGL